MTSTVKEKISSDNAIVLDKVEKYFRKGKEKIHALNKVSLSIKSGEIVALLGPNGAGKSTLIKCLVGLLGFDPGTIRISGTNIKNIDNVATKVGLVREGGHDLYELLTPIEHLQYYGNVLQISKRILESNIERCLYIFDLRDVKNKLVCELSRGNRQRVSLAMSALHKPDFLLLDEPTMGLDQNMIFKLSNNLRKMAKQGTGVLFVSHRIDLVETLADVVYLINEGCIVEKLDMKNWKMDGNLSYKITTRLPFNKRNSNFKFEINEKMSETNNIVIQCKAAQLHSVLKQLSNHDVIEVTLLERSLKEKFKNFDQE